MSGLLIGMKGENRPSSLPSSLRKCFFPHLGEGCHVATSLIDGNSAFT